MPSACATPNAEAEETTHGSSAAVQNRPTLTTSTAKTQAAIGVPNTAAKTAPMPHIVRICRSRSLRRNSRPKASPCCRRAVRPRPRASRAAEQMRDDRAEEDRRREQNRNALFRRARSQRPRLCRCRRRGRPVKPDDQKGRRAAADHIASRFRPQRGRAFHSLRESRADRAAGKPSQLPSTTGKAATYSRAGRWPPRIYDIFPYRPSFLPPAGSRAGVICGRTARRACSARSGSRIVQPAVVSSTSSKPPHSAMMPRTVFDNRRRAAGMRDEDAVSPQVIAPADARARTARCSFSILPRYFLPTPMLPFFDLDTRLEL